MKSAVTLSEVMKGFTKAKWAILKRSAVCSACTPAVLRVLFDWHACHTPTSKCFPLTKKKELGLGCLAMLRTTAKDGWANRQQPGGLVVSSAQCTEGEGKQAKPTRVLLSEYMLLNGRRRCSNTPYETLLSHSAIPQYREYGSCHATRM